MKKHIRRAMAVEKRLFFILVAVMMVTSIQAEGHMKFKGIEIDGVPQEFVQKLKAKGFTHIGKENGSDMLLGDFAGFKNCVIGVASYADKVAKVAVIIPDDSNSWSLFYGKYASLKEMLTQKYGEPSADEEEWQGYEGKPKDDNSCMHELKMDRAKIGSYFETPEGNIELLILSIKMQCCIMIAYYDAVNYKAALDSAMEDL